MPVHLFAPLYDTVLLTVTYASRTRTVSLASTVRDAVTARPRLTSHISTHLSTSRRIGITGKNFCPSISLGTTCKHNCDSGAGAQTFNGRGARVLACARSRLHLQRVLFSNFGASGRIRHAGNISGSHTCCTRNATRSLTLHAVRICLRILGHHRLIALTAGGLRTRVHIGSRVNLHARHNINDGTSSSRSSTHHTLTRGGLSATRISLTSTRSGFFGIIKHVPSRLRTPTSAHNRLPGALPRTRRDVIRGGPCLGSTRTSIRSTRDRCRITGSPFCPHFSTRTTINTGGGIRNSRNRSGR